MKKIIKVLRKILLSFILLYTYNVIAVSYNLVIPINIFTLGITTLLDAPGLIMLAIIFKLFYWGWYYGRKYYTKI